MDRMQMGCNRGDALHDCGHVATDAILTNRRWHTDENQIAGAYAGFSVAAVVRRPELVVQGPIVTKGLCEQKRRECGAQTQRRWMPLIHIERGRRKTK